VKYFGNLENQVHSYLVVHIDMLVDVESSFHDIIYYMFYEFQENVYLCTVLGQYVIPWEDVIG
jgi:hypothetical protein